MKAIDLGLATEVTHGAVFTENNHDSAAQKRVVGTLKYRSGPAGSADEVPESEKIQDNN